ncbi:MAG: hypothetical protein HRU13_12840 [Phycisphaerales bacterium]|nr:hypothetical protein [Phycisphaerales bacterium]
MAFTSKQDEWENILRIFKEYGVDGNIMGEFAREFGETDVTTYGDGTYDPYDSSVDAF